MTAFGGTLDDEGTHRLPVRVYFEDTDFSTNVYHAAYLKFFERGRTEFLRARGIHHADLAARDMAFAVRDMSISYDKPAKIDDLLEVATRLEAMSGARFVLEQAITKDGVTLCRTQVTAVLLTMAGKPVRLPAELRALFTSA